ncbi:MAG TPA: fused MFS/spermidine synthase [Gemmataceae bacterium]|nr:fused MFS/spermidine synthase [Gemmataceae bacterium]
MGSAAPAPLPLGRLAGVGLVIFFANAALLVLQLVAGRLLSPYIGSSLETWTSVIGVFLAGIALGNGFGGKLADRYPRPGTLAVLLALGAVTALWILFFPKLLAASGLHKVLPLGPRIPILATLLCLPAGLVLSLLTPVAIKLGLPDVSKTGRVAGLIFSLSTLGCLLGNYVTGFYLIPMYAINTLVVISSAALFALAIVTLVLVRTPPPVASDPAVDTAGSPEPERPAPSPYAFADIRTAYLIVFVGSFCGMTLELTASRVIAQRLGVSLFTWTGIIGVMLAGTAFGNLLGGMIADWVNRPASKTNPRNALGLTLIAAGGVTVLMFVTMGLIARSEMFNTDELVRQVLQWTFALFFLPMFVLGMVSPQVIRLSVADVAHAGSVAGRVYAWSTTGAIVGTFATGYALLSTFGMYPTILLVSLALACASLLAVKVWEQDMLLYGFAIVLGGVTGGFILKGGGERDANTVAVLETNYYTIRVAKSRHPHDPSVPLLDMRLDLLLHSTVDPENPTYLYYTHEHIQMEFLREARAANPEPKVLVIGGGGYTFPRCAKTLLPETQMDVVEIDPGVTRVAYESMGLRKELGIRHFHMDGRQYVSEKVPAGTYDVVMQDAVNDLSVPGHLLTKEYNDAVKVALKPNGVYLLTIIDSVEQGYLWKAAMRTLRLTFPEKNVHLIAAGSFGRDSSWAPSRAVYVIYASDKPLDVDAMQAAVKKQFETGTGAVATPAIALDSPPPFYSFPVPQSWLDPFLEKDPGVILTDQYAPVDNLMAEAFRNRNKQQKTKPAVEE